MCVCKIENVRKTHTYKFTDNSIYSISKGKNSTVLQIYRGIGIRNTMDKPEIFFNDWQTPCKKNSWLFGEICWMRLIPSNSTCLKHPYSITVKCIFRYACKRRCHALHHLLVESEIPGHVLFKVNRRLPASTFIINEFSAILYTFVEETNQVSMTYSLMRMFMT